MSKTVCPAPCSLRLSLLRCPVISVRKFHNPLLVFKFSIVLAFFRQEGLYGIKAADKPLQNLATEPLCGEGYLCRSSPFPPARTGTVGVCQSRSLNYEVNNLHHCSHNLIKIRLCTEVFLVYYAVKFHDGATNLLQRKAFLIYSPSVNGFPCFAMQCAMR